MTHVTITLTLDEAKVLLHAVQRDFDEYRVERERAVIDRLAETIEEAEKEESAYHGAATGGVHWDREQPYEGPSRYAHPAGDEVSEHD